MADGDARRQRAFEQPLLRAQENKSLSGITHRLHSRRLSRIFTFQPFAFSFLDNGTSNGIRASPRYVPL
jgi:hypothetical protein